CFESILLRLSGGLDSSIVATCLATAPTRPEVICVNYRGNEATTDERAFAASVAGRTRFEIFEMKDDGSAYFDVGVEEKRTLLPVSRMYRTHVADAMERLMYSRNVFIAFQGDGGDELFYRDGPIPDAADYAWLHGMGLKLLKVAWNDAVLDNRSIYD